jgi:hypothetical protein
MLDFAEAAEPPLQLDWFFGHFTLGISSPC